MMLNQHKNLEIIIASRTSETMGKLINRIPGSCLMISSLPGLALRTHVESLGEPHDVNRHSQNLILKDTHLLFSIYLMGLSKTTYL